MAQQQHNTDTPMRSLFPNTVNTAAGGTQNPAASTARAAGCAPTSSASVAASGAGIGPAHADFRLKQENASLKSERDRYARENSQLQDKLRQMHQRCTDAEQQKAAAIRDKVVGESQRDKTKFLETRIKELQERLAAAEHKQHDAEKHLTEAQTNAHSTIEQWQAHSQKQDVELGELRGQVEMARREVSSRDERIRVLEETVAERNGAVDGQEGEISKLKTDVFKLTEEKLAAEVKADGKQSEWAEAMEQLNGKDEQIAAAAKALAEEQERLVAAHDEGRRAAERIKELETSLADAGSDAADKKTTIAGLRAQVEQLEARVEDGVKENADITSKHRGASEQVAMLKQRLAHLESDVTQRADREKDLLKQFLDQKSTSTSQADQLSSAVAGRERALADAASAQARVLELEMEIRDRDRAMKDLKAEGSSASSREEELRSELRLLHAECDSAKEDLRKVSESHAVALGELRDDIEDREQKITRLEKQCAALESTATSTRSDLTAKTTDFASRIDFLEGEVRTKALQVAALEETAQTLERKNQHLQQSLEETTNCLGECQTQLRTKADECNELHSQLGDIRSDLQMEMNRHRRDAEEGQQRELTATATAAEAVQAMRSELQQLRDLLTDKETQLRRADTAASSDKARSEQLARQLDATRDELQQKTLRQELISAELSESRHRNDELLRRIEHAIEQFAEKDTQLQEEQSRLLAQQRAVEKKEAEAEELRGEIAAHVEEIAAGKRAAAELEGQLEQQRQGVAALQEQLALSEQQRLAAMGDAEAASALERQLADAQAALLNASAEIRRVQDQAHGALKERAGEVERLELQLRESERSIRDHDALHATQDAAAKRDHAELHQRVLEMQSQARATEQTHEKAVVSLKARIDQYKRAYDREIERHREYKKAYEIVLKKFERSEEYRGREREMMYALRDEAQQFMAMYQEAARQLTLQRNAMEEHNHRAATTMLQQQQQQQNQHQNGNGSTSQHRYSDEDMAAAQKMEAACSRLSNCLMTVQQQQQQQQQNGGGNGPIGMRDMNVAPRESGVPRKREEIDGGN